MLEKIPPPRPRAKATHKEKRKRWSLGGGVGVPGRKFWLPKLERVNLRILWPPGLENEPACLQFVDQDRAFGPPDMAVLNICANIFFVVRSGPSGLQLIHLQNVDVKNVDSKKVDSTKVDRQNVERRVGYNI
jgi:hypothetical protein